jgi:hypothetical protein
VHSKKNPVFQSRNGRSWGGLRSRIPGTRTYVEYTWSTVFNHCQLRTNRLNVHHTRRPYSRARKQRVLMLETSSRRPHLSVLPDSMDWAASGNVSCLLSRLSRVQIREASDTKSILVGQAMIWNSVYLGYRMSRGVPWIGRGISCTCSTSG